MFYNKCVAQNTEWMVFDGWKLENIKRNTQYDERNGKLLLFVRMAWHLICNRDTGRSVIIIVSLELEVLNRNLSVVQVRRVAVDFIHAHAIC